MTTATIVRTPRMDATRYISPEALKRHLHEGPTLTNIRRVRPKTNQSNKPVPSGAHPGLWSPPVTENTYRATVRVPSANRKWFVRLEGLEVVPDSGEILLSPEPGAYDLKSPGRAVITF